jgi:RHS repeat-associated protein
LASVRDITDNTGTVQDHIDYDAFGNVIFESTPSFSDRYKYTGRESDVETGLQYNRARYYDPKAGRWMAKDPIGFAAGDANLYRYVGNDPTSYVDPSGRGEQPTDDGSNLQWITQEKMKDLVDNKLAREVKVGVKSHRIIITAYGSQIRAFDYKLDVNPAKGGDREWAFARTYGFGNITDEADLESQLNNVNNEEVATRLAKNTDREAMVAGELSGLNFLLTAITLIPGGSSAEAIDRGDYVDAVVSFIGDVALLGSFWEKGVSKAAKAGKGAKTASDLAKSNRALLSFQAIEGTIAVARLGQAGYAIANDEEGKAAAYFGEALLRIFGVAYARRSVSIKRLKGTEDPFTAWAAKTGRAYDRRFREFWRQFEGKEIGDGWRISSVNRRLDKGI